MQIKAQSEYHLSLQNGVIRLQQEDFVITLKEKDSIVVQQSPERVRFALERRAS